MVRDGATDKVTFEQRLKEVRVRALRASRSERFRENGMGKGLMWDVLCKFEEITVRFTRLPSASPYENTISMRAETSLTFFVYSGKQETHNCHPCF